MNALILAAGVTVLAGCATTRPAVPPAPPADAAPSAYRLLEPAEGAGPDGLALVRDLAPDDPRRDALDALMALPYPGWVLRLGSMARDKALTRCLAGAEGADICRARHDHPALFVIKPKGNRPKRGLAIAGAGAVEVRPEAWYVEVDPRRAAKLVPHEYGHAIMFELIDADPPEHPGVLPHTTRLCSGTASRSRARPTAGTASWERATS